MRHAPVGLVAAAGVTAVVLGVISTLALAALSGAFTRPGLYAAPYPGASAGQSAGCTVPAPPGRVVEVRVADMGAMMDGPYRHGPGTGDGYRSGDDAGPPWPPGMGWMDMTVSPTPVRAGEISLLVTNLGWRPHELVVLPLAAGRALSTDQPLGRATARPADPARARPADPLAAPGHPGPRAAPGPHLLRPPRWASS